MSNEKRKEQQQQQLDKTRERFLMQMTPEQRKKVILDEFAALDNMPSSDFWFGGRIVPDFFPDDEKKDIMDSYRRGNC